MTELEAGRDQLWPIDKVIQEIKRMKPHFPPGKTGRVKYGDTNHQILSVIIEHITGEPVEHVLNTLFQELHLTNTYVCDEAHPEKFVPIRYKSEERYLPLFLNSTHNDIVSTARDQMTFLKAFFSGYFFPKERLHELEQWNRIFFPFHYGIGIQKFSMPRIFSLFHPAPEMIGHCGSTGSVAFYVPTRDLYITGTINQQARPNIAFQTMIKILR
jgi:CubicO group peptidase (beta-lactamase class C family)